MLGVHVQVGPPRFLLPLGWRAKSLQIFIVFVCAKCLSWFTDLFLCDSEVTRGHRPQLCRVSGCRPIQSFVEQLVADVLIWQHTTLARDRHGCPGGSRTHNPSKREAADPRLRPRSHGDRLERNLFMVYLTTLLILRLVWRRIWVMIVNIVLEEIQKEILWAKRFCTEKNHDWSQSKWALYPAWFWILLLRNVVETAKQFRFDFRWLATILEFSWVIGFCGLKWTRMFGGVGPVLFLSV